MLTRMLALAALLLAIALAPWAAQAQQQPSGLEPLVPSPERPAVDRPSYWGAIAFTADGSWATTWKMLSKAEAEAKVAVDCAKFGRGSCKVISFTGEVCVGMAAFTGRRWKLSFTAGGTTTPEAQQAALDRCNADTRTRKGCQLRTVVCGDGR